MIISVMEIVSVAVILMSYDDDFHGVCRKAGA